MYHSIIQYTIIIDVRLAYVHLLYVKQRDMKSIISVAFALYTSWFMIPVFLLY